MPIINSPSFTRSAKECRASEKMEWDPLSYAAYSFPTNMVVLERMARATTFCEPSRLFLRVDLPTDSRERRLRDLKRDLDSPSKGKAAEEEGALGCGDVVLSPSGVPAQEKDGSSWQWEEGCWHRASEQLAGSEGPGARDPEAGSGGGERSASRTGDCGGAGGGGEGGI
jgi:hypothetical protein